MATTPAVPIDRITARRIGFVADTHGMQPDGSDLPAARTVRSSRATTACCS